jgi:hypothetical protein
VLFALACFSFPVSAHAQYYLVDCSGTNWWAFPTITAALQYASFPGANIVVTGACNNENFVDSSGRLRPGVGLNQKHDLRMGAYWGQTASIKGGIYALNSDNIYLYGLTTTNANGNGIEVDQSKLTLDTCSSSGNQSNGLLVENASYVELDASGAFNDNAGFGLYVIGNSFLNIAPWAGHLDVQGNNAGGIWASQGEIATGGNTYIKNSGTGFAIDFRGGAKGQFGNWAGQNFISDNPGGGVSLQENAEISFWACCSNPPTVIRNNGPFGISASFGSQVTLAGAQVLNNPGVGIDVYAHSQLYANSNIPGLAANQIAVNGSAGDPMSAAIRVDGNSQAVLRGGDVSQNNGPGVLALVNSSVDFAGVNFTGNAGVITCDSTATMTSDLSASQSTPASGVACKSPHGSVNRAAPKVPTTSADVARYKAKQDEYRKAISGAALNAPQP